MECVADTRTWFFDYAAMLGVAWSGGCAMKLAAHAREQQTNRAGGSKILNESLQRPKWEDAR